MLSDKIPFDNFRILAAVVLFSALTTLLLNFAYAQTLDETTVEALLNGFNPVVRPIPTKSFVEPNGCPIPTPDDSQGAINKIQCGLYASDPLNNETKTHDELKANNGNGYWYFGGSADGFNPPAPTDFFKDAEGLHIGVQSPANGTYAGYYAVSPNTNGMLFHAEITSPFRTIPSNYFQNGIYVQTSHDPINYISCVSVTNNLATLWAVGHVYSSPDQALVFNPLYVDTSADQPLTRECTIITNGNNYLEVYLDNVLVYSSNTIALAMPAPFIFFLEPQTSYEGDMLYGTYRDYYATTTKNIRVENAPQDSATAEMVDVSGNVLASSPVILGNAQIDIAKYHYPVDAYLKVYDPNRVELASTPITYAVYGGDLYYVVGPTLIDTANQTATTTINTAIETAVSTMSMAIQTATDTINTANQTATSTIDNATQTATNTLITANQTATSTINTAIQTAVSTVNTALQTATDTINTANQTAMPIIDNTTQTAVSTMDMAIQTATDTINTANQTAISTIIAANQTASDTVDTATHQLVGLTVDSADLSGATFPGMWVELWRDGILIQEGYTPFSTYVQTGTQYEVFVDNWQNIIFDHWEDGSTDQRRAITPTQDMDLTAFFRTT